jgi:hypothetical protein
MILLSINNMFKNTFNSKLLFFFLFLTLSISSFPKEDLVDKIPNYNYDKSRLFSGYLQLSSGQNNKGSNES